MNKEVIRIKGSGDDRNFHLLVERLDTDTEGLEEVAVSFMMDQEQRAAFLDHLAGISEIPEVVGFTVTFGVNSTLDPRDGLRIFGDSIRDKS